MKCLWRVIKAMPKWLEEEGDASINLDDVLSDVHEFFKTFPSNFWRRRETDTPIRYIYHSLDGELFFCHLAFLAVFLVFSIHHLGLNSMRATASYSDEGLVAVAI